MYCGTPNWIGAKVCSKCHKNISLGGFIEFKIEQKFQLFLKMQLRNGLPKELEQKMLKKLGPTDEEEEEE
jgi:hypothetical protein